MCKFLRVQVVVYANCCMCNFLCSKLLCVQIAVCVSRFLVVTYQMLCLAVETECEEMLKLAETEEVAFLVVGDVYGATTHTDIAFRAKSRGIKV